MANFHASAQECPALSLHASRHCRIPIGRRKPVGSCDGAKICEIDFNFMSLVLLGLSGGRPNLGHLRSAPGQAEVRTVPAALLLSSSVHSDVRMPSAI